MKREKSLVFDDRRDAGRQLAAALSAYRSRPLTVLALPRGGVVVAAEVAAALGAPLDLVIARKIGVPFQPELAMGAVAEGPEPVTVRNEGVIAMADVSQAEFDAVRAREIEEMRRRRERYLAGRVPVEVAGRTVIVVDDGVATGASIRAALRSVRARGPKRLVLAAPVAAPEALDELRKEADDIVCLQSSPGFGAIGFYYRDFRQVSDEEVTRILEAFPPAG